MITEKRILIIGVEHNGQIHRDLEIRSHLVKHLVAASSSELMAQNKNNYEVCCLAEQIVRLGDIPKTEITGALLLEMESEDFDVLTEAAQMVRQRTISFRSKAGIDQKADTGPGQDGV